MDSKLCSNCKIVKSLNEFHKQPVTSHRSGRHAQCKACRQLTRKKYPEKTKEYRNANSDLVLGSKYARCYWPDLNWRQALDKYNAMLIEQNSLCAICNKPETAIDSRNKKLKRLAVDHDHDTLKVRRLLCDGCNRAIGFLKDSSNVCFSAFKYLKEFNK